jgi:hypothetical protein
LFHHLGLQWLDTISLFVTIQQTRNPRPQTGRKARERDKDGLGFYGYLDFVAGAAIGR